MAGCTPEGRVEAPLTEEGCSLKAAQRFTKFALYSFPALMALLGLPVSQAIACGASVQVLDTWVEQGNFFHVQFRIAPQNCLSICEGLIEFRVDYESFSNRETDSVFGLSTWHFDPEEETMPTRMEPLMFPSLSAAGGSRVICLMSASSRCNVPSARDKKGAKKETQE